MKDAPSPKRPFWLLIAAIAALWLGSDFLWKGATHKGGGFLTVGGDQPGTGGMISTDEHTGFFSERVYRRDSYVTGCIFLALGGMLMWSTVQRWKRGDDKTEADL
jgi:hypothetical protein